MCPLRHASSALAVAVLLFAVGLGTPRAASPVADAAQGDFAGLFDIGGGRRLYIECRGTGSPAVILEAGYRSSARIWSEDLHPSGAPRPMVLAGVAAFTRVCAYDRPGTVAPLNDDVRQSRSDPVAMPRTAMDAVADLHALLRAAGVPGSYVFAGHSLGGLFVRLYASTYPRDVLGLVLVDAYSETLETLLTPERWEALVRLNVRSGSDTVKTIPSYGDLETIGYGKDNLFIFLDGHRPCKVTDNRAAVDFATCGGSSPTFTPTPSGSASSWTIYRRTRPARSTKPFPLVKRVACCAGWNSTLSPSTPVGSTWLRSRSACCAASAWTGASQPSSSSNPRSPSGNDSAKPQRPASKDVHNR